MEMDVNGLVLLSWVIFGYRFATMGQFWSGVCCCGCVWFMVLSSFVGFVMGLLSWPILVMGLLPWMGFVHRPAAVGRFCHGLAIMDGFWLWVCCYGLWVCCHGSVLVMGYWWWGECEWRFMKNLLVLYHKNLESVTW